MNTDMQMTSDNRYARQIRFSGIGQVGQDRLSKAHIAIVGVGALGCACADALARAGIGTLTLIDRDLVEASNLQRQLLYTEADAAANKPKAIAAADRLAALNRDIRILPHIAHLGASNAEQLLSDVDLILDGTDNFAVRYLLNEISVKHSIPWIYAGAVGASGMTMTIIPGETPCLHCLFPVPPAGGMLDTCETAGVLSPIISAIASVQTMEALKWISGNSPQLHRSLLQIDLWRNERQAISLTGARKPNCPVCAERNFDRLNEDPDETLTLSLCGRKTIQIHPPKPSRLQLESIAKRWEPLGEIELNSYFLRLSMPDQPTLSLFRDGRALVSGTDDEKIAQRLYAGLMGE
jgi:molybdopterin-synthase adenylyltransferase